MLHLQPSISNLAQPKNFKLFNCYFRCLSFMIQNVLGQSITISSVCWHPSLVHKKVIFHVQYVSLCSLHLCFVILIFCVIPSPKDYQVQLKEIHIYLKPACDLHMHGHGTRSRTLKGVLLPCLTKTPTSIWSQIFSLFSLHLALYLKEIHHSLEADNFNQAFPPLLPKSFLRCLLLSLLCSSEIKVNHCQK